MPISSEATNAPASEPMPPTTTTTKITGPTLAAIAGSVTNVVPPMTPASPASAEPAPKTSMKTRGTLWPSDSTISGWVSALWMTRPMRVLVSSSQSATSIASATSIMKARVPGNGEQTTRTAASALVHIAGGAAPLTRCNPESEELMSVNAGPRRISGGGNSTEERPHTSRTSSMITNDSPNVISSSGTWPNLCTLRRHRRSKIAPRMPTMTGATTSAGQKPVTFEIEYAMYAPIM
jgi:hypothetical protein